MSSYLLISSTYRDRILYPNPADFIIPFQQTQYNITTFNVFNTINPLSVYPIYNFSWTNYGQLNKKIFKTKIIGGGGSNIKLPINEVCVQLLGINANDIPNNYLRQKLEKCQDILKNYSIRIVNKGKEYLSNIIAFSPIYCIIKLAEPIPFDINDPIDIINTSILKANDTNQSQILINGIYNQKLFLGNDLYLYNITTNEVRKCIFNDVEYKLICSPAFSDKASFTDKYLIYNTLHPFVLGHILKFPNNKYYIENCLNSYTIIHKGSGYKKYEQVYLIEKGKNIENDNDHTILNVQLIDSENGILEMSLEEIGCQQFNRSGYYIVVPKEKRFIDYAIIFINNISTAFRCKIKKKFEYTSRDFIGNYFTCFLLSPIYNINGKNIYTSPNNVYPVNIEDESQNNYNSLLYSQEKSGVFGIEKSIFLSENEVIIFVQKISPILLYRFELYESLPDEIKQGTEFLDATNFCIQNFKKDGVVPLNFTGTYLTQSQMSCYEITVLNLILPNLQIDALDSLLTSGFPYVLLEISNVTMPNSHNKNAIYSNNPSAINTTFVCSISDVNDPIRSRYIKISSDGTVQTLKFSPADNLKIKILLPSGETFKLLQKDYLPPSVANPDLQIELLLEIKKLS